MWPSISVTKYWAYILIPFTQSSLYSTYISFWTINLPRMSYVTMCYKDIKVGLLLFFWSQISNFSVYILMRNIPKRNEKHLSFFWKALILCKGNNQVCIEGSVFALVLEVLEFELRTLSLLGRCSTTWITSWILDRGFKAKKIDWRSDSNDEVLT
jgi:hypothetical protein